MYKVNNVTSMFTTRVIFEHLVTYLKLLNIPYIYEKSNVHHLVLPLLL